MPFVKTPKFPGAVAAVADLLNLKDKVPAQASPTLAANITNVATSFDVAAGTGARLPADNFVILVESELMFVGSRSTDTLSSVTRGIEGTTAAAHNSGIAVEAFIIAAHHNQLAAEVNALEIPLQGLALAMPIAGIVKPVDGDFAWVNQGSALISAGSDGRLWLRKSGEAGTNTNIRKKAAPATPYTLTAGFVPILFAATTGAGILVRESSTGKFVLIYWRHSNTLGVLKMTNATTVSAAYTTPSFFPHGPMVWLQIEDNGTNLISSVSMDGENFLQVHSISRTDFMAGGPDEIGFALLTTASDLCGMTLVHWKQA